MLHYRLRGREVEPCYSLVEWGRWFETGDRRVALTTIGIGDEQGGEATIEVSSVFLGIDHGWGEGGPPVLFETMVFSPEAPTRLFDRIVVMREESSILGDGTQERYCTWAEAEAGHERIVAAVQAAVDKIKADAALALGRITAGA